MAKFIVTGEAYLDTRHQLHPVGSEVELPDGGPHSVPPPGWIDVDLDEPVTREEHDLLAKELAGQMKAQAEAETKARIEAARKRKAEKKAALAGKPKDPSAS